MCWRRERRVGHFLHVPPRTPERPPPPPAPSGNGLPTTPDASGGCAGADAIASFRTVCRVKALVRGRAPAMPARARRDDPVPSSARMAMLQASQNHSPRSERDGDANPVGKGGGQGRSGPAGGHGGIRIPVVLAQHTRPNASASPSCSLSTDSQTQTHPRRALSTLCKCYAQDA
jgi:hypothetical protein